MGFSKTEPARLVLLLTIDILVLKVSGSSICSPLPFVSLSNGKISSIGFQKFRFTCDRGYYLAGPAQIRCFKGDWSSTRTPVCLKTEGHCDPPPSIPNADVLGDEDAYVGSAVQYMCHEGHILLGNGRRICLSGGGWSGITPACLNESEPIQHMAERLDKTFITEMGSYAQNNSIQQARYLDRASLRRGLELIILIDRSSSVDPFDLETGKSFLKFIFEEFNVKNVDNSNGTRAAVVAFGTNVDVLFNVNDTNITDSNAANKALDELLKPGGGGTAMVPAFTIVFLRVEPLLRANAKKALFLITDGEPNIGGEDVTPEDMASQLKKYADFEIFAMGIGPDVNRQLLTSVASEPVLNHVFLLDKYSDLASMMSVIKNRPPEVPPVSPEKCGHVKEYEKNNRWPWMAAVYVSVEGKENATHLKLCGGVLICKQWVLTAASCFHQVDGRNVSLNLEETFVVLGEYNLLKMDKDQNNFYAEDVFIHRQYNPLEPTSYNIAVIKLNKNASLRDYRTVCLPPTDKLVPLHMDLAVNASVAGWGLAPPKNGVENIGARTIGFNRISKAVALSEERACYQAGGMRNRASESPAFCAESGKPGQCTGIEGSPVIAQDPTTNIHHVLGILSQRTRCDHGYSLYTELRRHIKWINDVTSRCHFQHWN